MRIDGENVRTLALNALAANGNLRYFEQVATGLDPAKDHVLELIPILGPGEEIRLESICLAGGQAKLATWESARPEPAQIVR